MEPNQNQSNQEIEPQVVEVVPLVVSETVTGNGYVNESVKSETEQVTPINPATSNTSSTSGYLSSSILKLLYVCLGLFIMSSLGKLFPQGLGLFIFGWYIAAGLSFLAVLLLFFRGILQGFSGKSFKLVGVSIVSFVVLLLVGYGTCLINIKGM
jgi:hypothetical protein